MGNYIFLYLLIGCIVLYLNPYLNIDKKVYKLISFGKFLNFLIIIFWPIYIGFVIIETFDNYLK